MILILILNLELEGGIQRRVFQIMLRYACKYSDPFIGPTGLLECALVPIYIIGLAGLLYFHCSRSTVTQKMSSCYWQEKGMIKNFVDSHSHLFLIKSRDRDGTEGISMTKKNWMWNSIVAVIDGMFHCWYLWCWVRDFSYTGLKELGDVTSWRR